jgi:hypothetical protein
MHMQFLGMAVVVCKSDYQGFKKAKEKTWDSVSLRKEVLKNSEARFYRIVKE